MASNDRTDNLVDLFEKSVAKQGSNKLFGTKIFITWGEHDMAENIIHLVLGRIEGAPEGVKGISLFIVPMYFPFFVTFVQVAPGLAASNISGGGGKNGLRAR